MVTTPTEQQAGPQQLQRKLDVLNQLVEVSQVMNSTLALDPLLQYIMQAAVEITGSEAASILLMDRFTHELRFAASTSADASDLDGIVVPVKGSVAGQIIEEDRAIIIEDVSQEPRHFRDVDRQIAFETRSMLGVPMRIKEKLIGVLEVLNKREERFTPDDVRYITILAAQAAVAIENAQLVTALRKAYEDLNKLDKLKSDFIAIASHELRTPLGIILGYASFLKEEAEGKASEHAEAVFRSALHLRSLIESMTNLRYVQIDDTMIDAREVPLREIVDMACADVKSMLQTRQEALELRLPEQELRARADPFLMAMALTNVLNNAVRFSPEGGTIRLEVSHRDRDAWIQIADTGIGLAADQLEKIFEQFYQVEDPMTRSHNGLGLGLAIARAIVEKHGGRIWAESAGLGHGSTFVMTVPLVGS